jgi:hypothetical protein
MAIDKSTWNKKVKVSQSTIDDIKRLGMSKALRLAKENAAGPQKGLVAEYQEATRRLYGDKRFATATGAKPKKAGVAADGKQYNPRYASKPSAASKPAAGKASTKYSPTKMSPTAQALVKKQSSMKNPPAKKDNTKSNVIKGVAGTAAAIGLLALTRGKGAGVIAKLSPTVGRALQSPVGRALSGTAEKAKTSATVAAGRAAAKAGKPVSQSQYDAMVSAARLAGKKVVTAPKKTAAAPKKAASAPKISRWDANAPKPKPTKKK